MESKEARHSIRVQAEQVKGYMPYNKVIKVGDNHVYVNDFADPSDLEQNIKAARILAQELEKDIYVRHHLDGGIVPDHKNPELAIGEKSSLGDLKTYEGKGSFDNFTKNALKKASKQGAHNAVLDISKGNSSNIGRLLYSSLKGQNRNIQRVYLIKGNKVADITRKQIEKLDFSALDSIK